MSQKGWALFLALGVIWGLPYLLIRIAVAELSPLIVAFGRTLIGALVLLPIALSRGALRPAFRRWGALLAFTLVEISGPWVLLGYAETRLNSSTAGILIAVVPLLTAVIMRVLDRVPFDVRRMAGLGVGFAGVMVLVGLDIRLSDLHAVGAALLAALGYAIGPIIVARRLADVPSIGVVTASLVVATLLYAPFAPWLWPPEVHAGAALSVLGLALVCTAAAFLLFFALIAEVGPARATVITYVNPAVAIALGVLILSEPLSRGMLIGFPLVMVGSLLGTGKASDAAV